MIAGQANAVSNQQSADRAGRYQPLVLVAIAACIGIVADRYWPQSLYLWLSATGISLLAWLIAWRAKWALSSTAALGLAVAALAAAWHHARWNLYAADDIAWAATSVAQSVCVEATVVSPPHHTPAPHADPLRVLATGPRTQFTVEVAAVRDGAVWRSASGRVRVSVEGGIENLLRGDRIVLLGQLAAITPASNPGEFDFAQHARADRELASIRVERADCITMISTGSKWNLLRWLDVLRARGHELLARRLDPDQSALAAAIFLGQRDEIDQETNDAFLRTGTIHILSISGLHVAILAGLLFAALQTGWMSRGSALAAVVVITGIYMLLTGADPPVVRATALVWIVCAGLWLGRPGLGMNSLTAAALIVLALNPADLFRIGVQLSFLSVAVLIWMGQKLADRPKPDPLARLIAATRPWPNRVVTGIGRWSFDMFVIGAVLWAVITPLTMSRFHVLSLSGLVLNIVLVPFVFVSMASGFALLAIGWLPVVGEILGWVCGWSLQAMQLLIDWAAAAPGGFAWVAGPTEAWLATFYLGLALLVAAPAVRRRFVVPRRWELALIGGWCGAGFIAALPLGGVQSALRCTFVSVGHGCGAVLEFADGKTVLYDAGRFGAPVAATRCVSSYLWSRGITHLDAVVVSHADTDHYNGLPGTGQLVCGIKKPKVPHT